MIQYLEESKTRIVSSTVRKAITAKRRSPCHESEHPANKRTSLRNVGPFERLRHMNLNVPTLITKS